MIELIVGAAVAVIGFSKSRAFVKRRLRYVEAVQKPTAPVLSGAAAAVVAAPVVALVPFIGAPVALALGLAVGAGTHAGARDIRQGNTSDD
jgi:hypothetical protein